MSLFFVRKPVLSRFVDCNADHELIVNIEIVLLFSNVYVLINLKVYAAHRV